MMFTASRQCSSGYRKCPNTGRCIDEDWFCDGDDDCGDMSDETGCRKLQATAATTVIKYIWKISTSGAFITTAKLHKHSRYQ